MNSQKKFRAMRKLEEDVEVCDEGFLGAKMGDKVTVLEENPGDEKAQPLSIGCQSHFFSSDSSDSDEDFSTRDHMENP